MDYVGWYYQINPNLRVLSMALMGAFVGMFIYVARISEGHSYLSDNPDTCINCHIMIPQYATWRNSSHRDVTCSGCHVPQHNIFAKYAHKAKDGARHSAIFTLRAEPHVIRAIPASQAVIQENCVRCHSRVMDDVSLPVHADTSRSCTECHREVPHGRVHSLTSVPNAAVPPLTNVTPDWIEEHLRVQQRGN
jgi:cytochrome c nitrite reductase small subunit